ncbi:hypothetical protein CEXT_282631 [Caerostris extrusa]|uniref:Uncharacterized protein n=1 Tax=Caerostris extrusa TaxID=172846 RepID=A0AAV4WEW2_CAEEX|nr:hypothetical protein CEXT_282631 [Caerostris extrusa]
MNRIAAVIIALRSAHPFRQFTIDSISPFWCITIASGSSRRRIMSIPVLEKNSRMFADKSLLCVDIVLNGTRLSEAFSRREV